MELIARIVIRRSDMGEHSAEHPLRQAPGKSLTVFRVQGRSLDRAMKLLAAEIDKQEKPVVVLAFGKGQVSDSQQSTLVAAYSRSGTLGAQVVVCGGDPGVMFDRLAGYRDSLNWFPNLHTYVSSLELSSRH
jgi:hypothetical protein